MGLLLVVAGFGCDRSELELRRPGENNDADGSGLKKVAQQHLPPVDCPLRKAGVNPDHLKPFEEVEKYIAFLERPDRQQWQKPDDVVAALKLDGSETVVDLGCGSGYFTFRFAKALPNGKVVALDRQPEMIRHIHHKVVQDGITNVEARIVASDDPGLPADVDLVFLCDVLHHVPNRAEWLNTLSSQMSSGAKLVLIEFKTGKLPEGPPESVKLSKNDMLKILKDAGFPLQEDRPAFLPYQEYLVFVKR